MSDKQNEFLEDFEKRLKGLGNKVNSMFENFVKKDDSSKSDLDIAADGYRRADEIVFELELPGIKKADVKLQVVDNQLVVRGKREKRQTDEKLDYHFRERTFGFFERSFTLPASALAEKTKAKFEDGLLTISIPVEDYDIEEQEITIE